MTEIRNKYIEEEMREKDVIPAEYKQMGTQKLAGHDSYNNYVIQYKLQLLYDITLGHWDKRRDGEALQLSGLNQNAQSLLYDGRGKIVIPFAKT